MIYTTTIDDCFTIPLKTIYRDEGELTIAEESQEVPFKIRRIYYIHNVPKGSKRGHHAHKHLYQLIIPINGFFDICVDDGRKRKIVRLSDPKEGLFIPFGIWRELTNFSKSAVCLVLASARYVEKDYIRDYQKFLKYKNHVPNKPISRHR